MDDRLTDDVMNSIRRREMTDKNDPVILAGASLGAQAGKYPESGVTVWSHLDVAIDLHHVHRAIVMDHRDGGASPANQTPGAGDPRQASRDERGLAAGEPERKRGNDPAVPRGCGSVFAALVPGGAGE
jgi:hypothetical protein